MKPSRVSHTVNVACFMAENMETGGSMDEENKAALEQLRRMTTEFICAAELRPIDLDVLTIVRELFNTCASRGIEARTLSAQNIYSSLASMRRAVTTRVKRPAISLQEKDVLRVIALYDPQEVTTAQIAAKTMISRDSVNAIVQSLLRKGLISRSIRSRMGYHVLSDEGRTVVAKFHLLAPVNAGALLPRPILVTPRRKGHSPHGM